jgi:hypothetical protein
MRPDIFGRAVAERVPVFAAVPRPRGLEEALLSRGLSAAKTLAASTRAWLPDVAGGVARLVGDYRASRLASFHRAYFAALATDAPSASPPIPGLPPCVTWPLDAPNDRLLQPAFIQQVTRALIAHDWTAPAIARLVDAKYRSDARWGDHWRRRDPWARAVFDVGVFAALIYTGLDEGVDFNCVSAIEKGVCPRTGCRFNLADIRDRMVGTHD